MGRSRIVSMNKHTVLMLLVLLSASLMTVEAEYAVYCGNDLFQLYNDHCVVNPSVAPRLINILTKEFKAKSFLKSKRLGNNGFELYEECCHEGCRISEVLRHCPWYK